MNYYLSFTLGHLLIVFFVFCEWILAGNTNVVFFTFLQQTPKRLFSSEKTFWPIFSRKNGYHYSLKALMQFDPATLWMQGPGIVSRHPWLKSITENLLRRFEPGTLWFPTKIFLLGSRLPWLKLIPEIHIRKLFRFEFWTWILVVSELNSTTWVTTLLTKISCKKIYITKLFRFEFLALNLQLSVCKAKHYHLSTTTWITTPLTEINSRKFISQYFLELVSTWYNLTYMLLLVLG